VYANQDMKQEAKLIYHWRKTQVMDGQTSRSIRVTGAHRATLQPYEAPFLDRPGRRPLWQDSKRESSTAIIASK